MSEEGYKFIDRTGVESAAPQLIRPVVIKKREIDAEIERLAHLPLPANGRRESRVAHPLTGKGDGLAFTIAVSVCVLKPGEHTKPMRHNASLVDFCIRGRGHTIVDGGRIDFDQYDVWTTPPWSVFQHVNDTNELQVRLSYSNSPLLEKLHVYVAEEDPRADSVTARGEETIEWSKVSPFGTFALKDDEGAWLMPYEKLINPDHIQVKPLHWPWQKVKAELDKLRDLGKSYTGRRLYLMYDPATGRTNGTTHTFFATITIRPNRWRRLKTRGSQRVIPMWPQLAEILRDYLRGPHRPTGDLLFPSTVHGREAMLTDCRKLLNHLAERAGLARPLLDDEGRPLRKGGWPIFDTPLRTKVFRHTYCAARLQTLDGGAPVSPFTVARELGHGSTAMVTKVYGHLGTVRHRAAVVEYRVEQHHAETVADGKTVAAHLAAMGEFGPRTPRPFNQPSDD